MRCERSPKTRPDLAVSAYGHPSSRGAGECTLHRGTVAQQGDGCGAIGPGRIASGAFG
jgi:hypothetical protein